MRITTKGRYALRAIMHLVEDKANPVSIKNISEIEKLSPIFLEQIFSKMKKAEILLSVRGAGGGFLLAKSPEKISVREILNAVEDVINLTPCIATKTGFCEHGSECRMNIFWNEANEHISDYFNSISLADVRKKVFS